jgi:hypothetical protein
MKTLKMVNRINVLKSIQVLLMFASVTLLSSCYATMDTPRPVRSEIVISGHGRGEHRDGNDRYERRRQRQERHHDNEDN